MTRQYKNPFEDPDADLYGKKVKDYKFSERKEAPLGNKVPDLEGYIYVPKIKLYVAKEKSLHGKNWYEAHKELHKQGLQMLTIRQFIDFIFYLEKNASIPDATKVLDEILTNRESLRGEWLDAKFSEETGFAGPMPLPICIGEAEPSIGAEDFPGIRPNAKAPPGIGPSASSGKKSELYINYNHRIENGKLVAKSTEPLEKCLMKSCDIDLKSCNRQGLPTKSGDDIFYFPPREGQVVGFSVDSPLGPRLSCGWGANSYPQIGVRAAKEAK